MSIEIIQEHMPPSIPAVPVVHRTLETLIEELQGIERAALRGLRVTTRSFWIRDSVGADSFTIKVIVSALTVQEGIAQVLFWTWQAGQFTEMDGCPWGTPTRKEVVGRAVQAQQKVTGILLDKLDRPTISEGVYYLSAEVLRPLGTTGLFTITAESAGNPARGENLERGS